MPRGKTKSINILSINIVQFAAIQFKFVDTLNSTARQASAERDWSSIARFYDNCKKKIKGKKGYPKFQKNNRSVEYKNSGGQLSKDRKKITFTDKKNIGTIKLKVLHSCTLALLQGASHLCNEHKYLVEK